MPSASKGLRTAYIVVGVILALMMFISASGKIMRIEGAVHAIHEVIGVPMSLFPVLAACEIAGGLGLLAGIFRPRLGLAAAAGLVLYFVGAIVAHILVKDFAGLKAPIVPFLLSVAALVLRKRSLPAA